MAMAERDVMIQVEVQGRNPAELEAEAIRHAQAFWQMPGGTSMFEVDLGTVYPVIWHHAGDGQRQVHVWQADATVRVRKAKVR